MERKAKYILLFVSNGITNQIEFSAHEKAEAIAAFKNVRMRADKVKLFSIDSEDDEIWYDIGKNY